MGRSLERGGWPLEVMKKRRDARAVEYFAVFAASGACGGRLEFLRRRFPCCFERRFGIGTRERRVERERERERERGRGRGREEGRRWRSLEVN